MRANYSNVVVVSALLLLTGACGGSGDGDDDGDDGTIPSVESNQPLSGAIDVALNGNASATFSEPMDPTTLAATTFKVTTGDPAVTVDGTVIYAGSTAVFWPAAHLAADTVFDVTITTGAESAGGVALAADYAWSFTTGDTLAPGLPVSLGTAGEFVILAKSGIATVPTSAVTGDIGVSPAAATFITGFSLSAHSSNTYATSSQLTGKAYAANYAVPTPARLTTAVSDMELAFTDAAGRAPDEIELGAGDIGGETLVAGVYKWGTGLLIPTDVTLSGSATDVWIFQIAQDLTMSPGVEIVMEGDALPANVFWQVSGLVELGAGAHLEGIVLSQTSITLGTGASTNGRLLAQTAATIRASTVVEPAE